MNFNSLRELHNGARIPFIWSTNTYGRAEFTFCLKYKQNKLITVYISPKQQPGMKENFIINHSGALGLQLDSCTYKGLESPEVWYHGYCREHKAPYFHVYVPPYSKSFEVGILSDICINFDNE